MKEKRRLGIELFKAVKGWTSPFEGGRWMIYLHGTADVSVFTGIHR